MKLNLPRVYCRGPPPSMTINSNVRRFLKFQYLENDPKRILIELYINRKLSQQKIASLFEVQHDTVRRWLDRLNIPVRIRSDSVSLAMTKHPKISFSGKTAEKAYLIGIRAGDLSSQIHGRNIRIQSGSTHPYFLELFENVFGGYGKVGKYPRLNRNKDLYEWSYYWSLYCDVDKSFEFVLIKPDRVPEWIRKNDDTFISFLSGYFDAEGCLSIDGKNHSLIWTVKSTDVYILRDIYAFLVKSKFNAKIRKEIEADGTKYKKNYWSVTICTRSQVLELLKSMKLKHAEKIMKYRLALELVNSNWKDANKKITKLRNSVKGEVKECVKMAQMEYDKRYERNREGQFRSFI